MNRQRLCKKIFTLLVIVTFSIILVFTPVMGPFLQQGDLRQASAAVDVGILGNQELDISYKYSDGKLNMTISGTVLANLGILSQQHFIYLLPTEIKDILENPTISEHIQIDYVFRPLLGILPISGTIKEDITVDASTGMITGVRNAALSLGLGATMQATLTINLAGLGVDSLTPGPDGTLRFYAIAAKQGLVQLDILKSEGASGQLIGPSPPTIDSITDADTTVSGTGEPGAELFIFTPGGNYPGIVDNNGFFSIEVPMQEAGTEISAKQRKDGMNSKDASTTVEGVTLAFTVPSTISFETTMIKLQDVTIHREIPDWSIIVRDTRGQGSNWRLKAKATGPLTSINGHTLPPDALVYVNDEGIFPLSQEVLIHKGTTGMEYEIPIQWGREEGVLIMLKAINLVDAQPNVQYSTTINWTLENAP